MSGGSFDPRGPRPCPGVILAGGAARRMGLDKCALPLGGRSMLACVVERVAAACRPVIVVARAAGDHQDCGAPVIADRWPGAGPLGGLITGLHAVGLETSGEPARAAVVACDLPLLSPAVLIGLLGLAARCDAAVPVVSGRPQPHCAVYGARALAAAERLFAAGERSLHALIQSPDLVVEPVGEAMLRQWDPTLQSFANINTVEDYARVRAAIGGGPGTA